MYPSKTPEAVAAYWQRWHAKAKADPEWHARRLAQKKADYEKHKAKRIEWQKGWAAKNIEKLRGIKAAWSRRNPEKEAELGSRRRARISQTGSEKVDYARVVREAKGMCGICRQPVGDGPVHIDHIIPLRHGGSHTQDNLQLAHARCNIAKGSRLPKVG